MEPINIDNWDGSALKNTLNDCCRSNQSKSLEQDEKIKREKLRKLLYKCALALSISSPLSVKLRERLSSILPKVSTTLSPWHEKYCTTNIRSHYADFLPYSSHLHPKFKPSRTLRSNTSIVDERTPVSSSSWSSSSKACYVHSYSFNRKQRYRRWNEIEDRFNSYPDDSDSYDNLLLSENSEKKSSLSAWSASRVNSTFPRIAFGGITKTPLDASLSYQPVNSDHNFEVNPAYTVFFEPDESNKSVANENATELPPFLGYEIILEPMNISTTSFLPESSLTPSPVSTSSSPNDRTTTIKCDQDKPGVIRNTRNLIKSDVKLIHKSSSEKAKKDVIPLRRSLRREQISNKPSKSNKPNKSNKPEKHDKSNAVFNGTNGPSMRVEPRRTQANTTTTTITNNNSNKNPSSVCDITLSNVSDGITKPSFSKQILKTEDVVIKHLSSSAEAVIKSKSSVKLDKKIQEKLIPLETTTITNSLRKVNNSTSQSIRHSKRTLNDEVMVIRTKDDLPRKKVDTDDVVMIKVMQTSKRTRLRK